MGVDVQGEACGEVTQHPGNRLDVYPVLQCQRCKGVAQIVEPYLWQSCLLQNPVQLVKHTVRGNGPAIRSREYSLTAVCLFPMHFQNAYRILCQW